MMALRLIGLALFSVSQRATRALADALDLAPSQPLYCRHRGPWCSGPHSNGRFEVYALVDGVGPSMMIAWRVHRWGPVVVAREWAPDGGGEAWVLSADDEVTGSGARGLRGMWEWMGTPSD